ncbi:MAG TPA: SMC-Scp complex subunit ScpB [Sutterella sp.]|nr:SMC-Scp complex subunit ScpB [Sutterella sp.]
MKEGLGPVIEALLLTAHDAMTIDAIREAFEAKPTKREIREALADLAHAWEDRGLNLVETGEGLWRFQTAPAMAPFIKKLRPIEVPQYSRTVLEILAVIAYKQPVTRGDIERIRGVTINPAALKTLFEREWIEVIGRRDAPGHPELLATTRRFLLDLGINSLEDLPVLEALTEENFELYDESALPATVFESRPLNLLRTLEAEHEELSEFTRTLPKGKAKHETQN